MDVDATLERVSNINRGDADGIGGNAVGRDCMVSNPPQQGQPMGKLNEVNIKNWERRVWGKGHQCYLKMPRISNCGVQAESERGWIA